MPFVLISMCERRAKQRRLSIGYGVIDGLYGGSMEIRYTLTLEDYTEGNRMLLLHTSLGRKVSYYVFVRYG